jgi:NAD(P)-dependent dehydrogenase (short-subunit alcohol dehydrogenase family)
MSTSPSERIALVTGAAQGIGRSIALRLAEDFDVAINDIPANSQALDSLFAEITAKGRRSCSVLADISVEDQVKSMISTVVTGLGGLDVVHSATPLHPTSTLMHFFRWLPMRGSTKRQLCSNVSRSSFYFIHWRVAVINEILS